MSAEKAEIEGLLPGGVRVLGILLQLPPHLPTQPSPAQEGITGGGENPNNHTNDLLTLLIALLQPQIENKDKKSKNTANDPSLQSTPWFAGDQEMLVGIRHAHHRDLSSSSSSLQQEVEQGNVGITWHVLAGSFTKPANEWTLRQLDSGSGSGGGEVQWKDEATMQQAAGRDFPVFRIKTIVPFNTSASLFFLFLSFLSMTFDISGTLPKNERVAVKTSLKEARERILSAETSVFLRSAGRLLGTIGNSGNELCRLTALVACLLLVFH